MQDRLQWLKLFKDIALTRILQIFGLLCGKFYVPRSVAMFSLYVSLIILLVTGCSSQFRSESTEAKLETPRTKSTGKVSDLSVNHSPFAVFDGIEFAKISAGRFVMGASSLEQLNQFNRCERPAHEVEITKPFYLSRCEITVGDFQRFVDDTGYVTDAERDGRGANSLNLIDGSIQRLQETVWHSPGFVQTNNHPVVCVSWDDAIAFCGWLSQRLRRRVRLPTEAEWEYCCRAGTETRFSTGDLWKSLDGSCNVGDQSLLQVFPLAGGTADWSDGVPFTCDVARFKPNNFGLFDMHGNVGEWCEDWFAPEYYISSPQSDPMGPQQVLEWHSVRGGSWYNSPESCRSSGRHDGIETMASTTNGFRIVIQAADE